MTDVFNLDQIPFDEPLGWLLFAMIALAVVVGPWVLLLGTRQLRQVYRIFANDPVDAEAVPDEEGIVEVEARAETLDRTLSTKYGNEPAVAHSWRRERREEETDDDGNTDVSYRTISRGDSAVPFLAVDETGDVAVDPSGATLSISESRRRKNRRLFSNDSERYREYEGRIAPGDRVHVYGQKRADDDSEDAPGDKSYYIGNGDAVEEFVVSDGSELRTVLRYVGLGALLVVIALVWIPISITTFLVAVQEVTGIRVPGWLLDGFIGLIVPIE